MEDTSGEFLLSDELKEFRQLLKKFFVAKISSATLKKNLLDADDDSSKTAPGRIDSSLWQQVLELGAAVAVLSEEQGGLGFGAQAAALIAEEAALAMAPLPISETVGLAAFLIEEFGSGAAKSNWLAGVADGSLLFSTSMQALLSVAETGGKDLPVLAAADKSGGFTLSGKVELVSYAEACNFLVLPAAVKGAKKDSAALYAVEVKSTAAEGKLNLTRTPTFDLLRPYYTIELTGVPATLVSDKLTKEAWSGIRDRVLLICASELLGVAEKAVEMTVEYVKTRTQFGQAIGSFQAVQHILANLYVTLQELAALSRFAAWTASNDPSQSHLATIGFASYAIQHAAPVIEKCLQLHGGIGFTYEYDLHLYLRRAQTLSRLCGSAIELNSEVGRAFYGLD